MRLAFYGRYSSDNQRETSIEDQRRIVERWAEQGSHTLVTQFTDYATSAANLKILNGLKQALRTAAATPAPFDALVVDQLSRLSRDVGDTDAIVKQLKFLDIRVIAVLDGIDTADESTKISVTVKSLVNEVFLDDLRKTTKRGLDGQFLKGFSTGGRTYGFRSEPVYGDRVDPHDNLITIGYRLFIDKAEANILRELFQLFAAGKCEKSIAKELNRKYSGQNWRPNTIYTMLRNTRYVGQFTFNRREWRKNPATGRRVYRWRPEAQWETQTFKNLRIIDHEIWEKVQLRLQTRQHLFADRKCRTNHLLSGFLICHRCGGRYSIISKSYYGCRNHYESGTCENDLRIRLEAVESLVISALAQQLPGWLKTIREKASRRPASSPNDGLTHTSERLTSLRQQAEALMAVIRSGRLTGRALDETLATYQQFWDEIEAMEREHQAALTPESSSGIHYNEDVVEKFADELPHMLRTDVRLGREFLQETLQHVRIEAGERQIPRCPVCGVEQGKIGPQHLAKHGLTLPTAYNSYPGLGFTKKARLIVQPSPSGILNTMKVNCSVVAGAGFEPATFGL